MTWLPQIEPVPSFELHLWKICLHYPVVIINWNIEKKKEDRLLITTSFQEFIFSRYAYRPSENSFIHSSKYYELRCYAVFSH